MRTSFGILALLGAPAVVKGVPFSTGVNDTSSGFAIFPPNGTSLNSNITFSSTSTSSSPSTSSTYVPESQPALIPDVHWNEPTGDIENLAPTTGQSLYYSNNGAASSAEQHTFAQLHTNTSYPSVVLAHSQYIQGVTCDDSGLHIDATDQKALAYIQSSWPASLPLIIVTFSPGCGASQEQRTFWLVNSLTFGSPSQSGSTATQQSSRRPASGNAEYSEGSSASGEGTGANGEASPGNNAEPPNNAGSTSNTIHAAVQQELPLGEAMPEIEIVWGKFNPDESSGSTKPIQPKPSSSPHSPYSSGAGGGGGSGTGGPGNSTTGKGNTTNSTSPSNSTTATNSSCGAPPSLQIDGFYTGTCGSPTFDQDIDNEIGFLDFDSADYSASLKDFAPGLDDDDSPSDNEDFGPVERKRSSLRRRGIFSKIVSKVGGAIGHAIAKVGDGIVSTVKTVGNAVSNGLALTPEASVDIPFNVQPSGLVDSPFGQAKQIYSKEKESKNGVASGKIAVYCVNCGVHGVVHLHGQARFSLIDHLTQFNAGLNGNIAAGLEIGIDASAEISDTLTYPIVSTAVPPGFSLPGVFAIGPIITLDAELALGITLAGQVLAGVTMSIPNFQANLDLVDFSKSGVSGFEPQFQKVFQAKTAITATAALGLPLGIGLGIDIPILKYKKTAALYDKPSIGATITYSGSTTGESLNGDNSCVNGIACSLEFGNDIYADFFGVSKVNINNLKVPVASTCIAVGGPTAPPSNTGSDQSGTGTDSNSDSNSQANPGTSDSSGNTASSGDANSSGSDVNSGETDTAPSDDQNPQRRAALLHSPSDRITFSKRQDNSTSGVSNSTDDFDYVDSDDPNQSADNTEFDALSEEAINEAVSESSSPTANDTGVVDDPGSSFVYINDPSNTYGLEADPITGNLYISDPGQGSLFAASEGDIVGDDAGRYFHYHPDLMTAYNVSRFRLSNETQIPKDADFVVLAPVTYDDSANAPALYAAFDSEDNVFLTITCDIEGEFSKVFLAQDAEQGVKALMDSKLRYTVTGGVVTSCYYLPFVPPPSSSSNATSS